MKTYAVEITETLQMTVNVMANSEAEAEADARAAYKNEEYILDSDHFIGVNFSVLSNDKI